MHFIILSRSQIMKSTLHAHSSHTHTTHAHAHTTHAHAHASSHHVANEQTTHQASREWQTISSAISIAIGSSI